MTKTVADELYLTTSEAMEELGASRKRFYDNARPLLQVYRFDAKKQPWYKHADILDLKMGRTKPKTLIVISGMYDSWTDFSESIYEARTENLERKEDVRLPQEIAERFEISLDRLFFKRSRLTRIEKDVICEWASYYPMSLLEGDTDALKRDEIKHLADHIRSKHNLKEEHIREITISRMNSFDELNLFQLRTDVPMLTVQRAVRAQGNGTLMWVTDMVLKGSMFALEHKYKVG